MVKKVELGEIWDGRTSNNYHIICQACMGFTTLGSLSLDFPMRERLSEFVDQVNKRKEIGSLYPKYNISCFRPPDWSEINKIEYYSQFIIEALTLHKLHIKSKYIAFIFDSFGKSINNELAEQALLQVYDNEFQSNYEFEILYSLL